MQKTKHAILAGAVLAAVLPLTAKAVTITYQFDPTITLLDANGNVIGPAVSATVGTNTTVTLPLGDFLQVNLDGSVSGDTNTAPASGANVVPANLGLASFQIGATDSKSSVAQFENSGYYGGGADTNTTTGAANANFATSAAGVLDGGGGITSSTGVFGGNTPNNTGSAAGATIDSYAAGTTATNLFGPLYIGGADAPAATNGTATFSLLASAANQAYFTYKTGGGTGKGATAPVYQNTVPGAADTINLGTLTVIVGTAVGTSTGPTHQPIISLVSATSPLTTYGAPDGALVLTGPGHGSYNVAVATPFVTATTGFVAVSGFTTADQEVYALKLDSNGTVLTAGQIATVIADINGTNGTTNAPSGVIASAISGVYSTLFPASQGYDVLLTASGVTNPAELGFDFSSAGEQDLTVPNITVLGVAAVPEPATAAGVVLGAAGLLLGRRKNKAILA